MINPCLPVYHYLRNIKYVTVRELSEIYYSRNRCTHNNKHQKILSKISYLLLPLNPYKSQNLCKIKKIPYYNIQIISSKASFRLQSYRTET